MRPYSAKNFPALHSNSKFYFSNEKVDVLDALGLLRKSGANNRHRRPDIGVYRVFFDNTRRLVESIRAAVYNDSVRDGSTITIANV